MLLRRTGVVAARGAAQRSFDWIAAAKKLSTPAARSELMQLKSTYDAINSDLKEARKPVEPIDFEAYKKVISDDKVVDALKKSYESIQLPKYEDPTASEALRVIEELKEEAKGTMEQSRARISELEELLTVLAANRSTTDTTIDEVAKRYPQLQAETMDEIKREEYHKDI